LCSTWSSNCIISAKVRCIYILSGGWTYEQLKTKKGIEVQNNLWNKRAYGSKAGNPATRCSSRAVVGGGSKSAGTAAAVKVAVSLRATSSSQTLNITPAPLATAHLGVEGTSWGCFPEPREEA